MVEALHSLVNNLLQICAATHLEALINTAMLFSPICMIFTTYLGRNVTCVSSEYIDDLMQEVVELSPSPEQTGPEPLQESFTLAPRMERPG